MIDNKKQWIFNEDDEWYTLADDVMNFISKVKIDKSKIIWCPFDTDESSFVKVLKSQGFNVVSSHIKNGLDFYKYEPESWDIIISNPPFKGKAKIIRRLIELGNKPFALIFGIQCLNSSGFTKALEEVKNLQIGLLRRRIKFTKDLTVTLKLPQPTFHSFWICNNILHSKLEILDCE